VLDEIPGGKRLMSLRESAKELIRDLFLQEGLCMFREHPRPFIYTFLLGVILTSILFEVFIRDNDKREIASLKERLGHPERKTAYTHYTNEELKREASRIAGNLRTLRLAIQEETSKRDRYFDSRSQSAQSDTERNVIASEYAQAIDEATNRWTDRFQQEYAGELRAISAEIYHRIPATFSRDPDSSHYNMVVNSGMLIGAYPLEQMITGLEKLATLLPDSTHTG